MDGRGIGRYEAAVSCICFKYTRWYWDTQALVIPESRKPHPKYIAPTSHQAALLKMHQSCKRMPSPIPIHQKPRQRRAKQLRRLEVGVVAHIAEQHKLSVG